MATVEVVCYKYKPLKNGELPLKIKVCKDRCTWLKKYELWLRPYHFQMYRVYQNEMYRLYHFEMYRSVNQCRHGRGRFFGDGRKRFDEVTLW